MSDYISRDEFSALVVLLVASTTFAAVSWTIWSQRVKHWKAKAAHHESTASANKKALEVHIVSSQAMWAEKEVARLEGFDRGQRQTRHEAAAKGVAVYMLDPGTGAIKFCWREDLPK